jgi:ABC-type Na+ transport system ATPase subunit NatA
MTALVTSKLITEAVALNREALWGEARKMIAEMLKAIDVLALNSSRNNEQADGFRKKINIISELMEDPSRQEELVNLIEAHERNNTYRL